MNKHEDKAADSTSTLNKLESAPSILLPLIAMHSVDQWDSCVSCSLLTPESDGVTWPCPTIQVVADLADILRRGDVHLLPEGSTPRQVANAEGKFELTTVEGDSIAVVPLFREQIAIGLNGGYATVTKSEAREVMIGLAKVS